MRLVIGGMVAVAVTVTALGLFGRRDSVPTAASESVTRRLGRDDRTTEPNPERALFREIVRAWQTARREAQSFEAGPGNSVLPVGPTSQKNTSKMDEEAKRRGR